MACSSSTIRVEAPETEHHAEALQFRLVFGQLRCRRSFCAVRSLLRLQRRAQHGGDAHGQRHSSGQGGVAVIEGCALYEARLRSSRHCRSTHNPCWGSLSLVNDARRIRPKIIISEDHQAAGRKSVAEVRLAGRNGEPTIRSELETRFLEPFLRQFVTMEHVPAKQSFPTEMGPDGCGLAVRHDERQTASRTPQSQTKVVMKQAPGKSEVPSPVRPSPRNKHRELLICQERACRRPRAYRRPASGCPGPAPTRCRRRGK